MSTPEDQPRLRALAAFLPLFEAPGFEIGDWTPPRTAPDGVISVGYFTLSEAGAAFTRTAAAHGWVEVGFDWGAWLRTEEARRLTEDASAVAIATPTQLAHLLTAIIRSERFGDGQIEGAYRSGLLTAIARRAEALTRPPPPAFIHGPPTSPQVVLVHRPQVLSWDQADTWAQERLIPYRDEIAQRFASVQGDGLSFRLECGLGRREDWVAASELEAAGDLDNLLIPVIDALGRSRFIAAWGTKDGGTRSRLSVGRPSVLGPLTSPTGHMPRSARRPRRGRSAGRRRSLTRSRAASRCLRLQPPHSSSPSGSVPAAPGTTSGSRPSMRSARSLECRDRDAGIRGTGASWSSASASKWWTGSAGTYCSTTGGSRGSGKYLPRSPLDTPLYEQWMVLERRRVRCVDRPAAKPPAGVVEDSCERLLLRLRWIRQCDGSPSSWWGASVPESPIRERPAGLAGTAALGTSRS